jgi:hypothetical protein
MDMPFVMGDVSTLAEVAWTLLAQACSSRGVGWDVLFPKAPTGEHADYSAAQRL